MNHNLLKTFSQEMTNIVSYGDMISKLEQIINHLSSQINVEFISKETEIYELFCKELNETNDELFQELMDYFMTEFQNLS